MRLCLTVLSVLTLTLAACGGAAPAPAASAAASAASPAASLDDAPTPTQVPQPTLIPTAEQASAAAEASPLASAEPAASQSAAASAQASTAVAPPFGRALQLADPSLEGDDVRQVQQRLVDLGYSTVGAVDGIYGQLTDGAVRAFQGINGLDVDGIVGPRTWERLFGDALPASALAPVVALPTRWLLGGSVDGRWLDIETTVRSLQGGERYRVPGSTSAYSGTLPATPEVPCELSYVIPLSPEPPATAPLAVGGSWEPLPRPAVDESPTGQQYRDTVAAFLAGEGIAQPDVQIERVLRADLDGDGGDELLINATNFAATEGGVISPDAAAGEYSVLLLQRADAAAPILVAGNVYPEPKEFVAPSRFELVGAFDLNGDGQMEVVVDGAYYEGAYTAVYDVLGSEPDMVLENGCGV